MKQNKKNRWPLSPLQKNYTLKNKTTFPKTLKKIVICPFFNWNWFPNSCSKSKIKQKRKTNQKKMEWELFFFFPKLTIRNSIDNNATPTPHAPPIVPPSTLHRWYPLKRIPPSASSLQAKRLCTPHARWRIFPKQLENISMMRTIYWKWAFCCGWTTIRCK